MIENKLPNFMKIYEDFDKLKPGPKAELRRISKPENLIYISYFYDLLESRAESERMQRFLFCLPLIEHKKDGKGDSLGQALAKANVNEKRLFMVIRSESPNDLIQLRRLLTMVKPTLDWPKMAKTLFYWNDLAKRKLLEDYFFCQKDKRKTD